MNDSEVDPSEVVCGNRYISKYDIYLQQESHLIKGCTLFSHRSSITYSMARR